MLMYYHPTVDLREEEYLNVQAQSHATLAQQAPTHQEAPAYAVTDAPRQDRSTDTGQLTTDWLATSVASIRSRVHSGIAGQPPLVQPPIQ